MLAPRHDARQEGVPPVSPDHAQRLPAEEVQELERLAEVVGGLHELMSLFLQNLPGKFSSLLRICLYHTVIRLSQNPKANVARVGMPTRKNVKSGKPAEERCEIFLVFCVVYGTICRSQ